MSNVEAQSFGDLLRYYRRAAGLTQDQLAERAGISERAVRDLERSAKLRPHSGTVERLAAALSLSVQQRGDFELAACSSAGPALPDVLNTVTAVAAAPTHNLPAPLTSFIGRSDELADVARRITGHRLVTLSGAGGVGKTRLAVEVGIYLVQGSTVDIFADGVWLVQLADLSRPALVAQALMRVLKLPEQIGRTPLELLQAYLADKQLLLILDNCEHLVEACAEVTEHLLQHCWRLHVLATSREELRIAGETVYQLLPLRLPDPLEHNPEQLLSSAAARLFVERIGGRPVQQTYVQDAATIAGICRQLDGIPLAIELAAPLARNMSLSEVAAQLHNQMVALVSAHRNTIPRHQTMHSALLWSYQLLTPAEQQLLKSVAVFAGGWTVEAAQAVCSEQAQTQLRLCLQQLVAKSLVLVDTLAGQWRYRLLEPVRQFALAQLVASDEQEALRRRHAAYFLSLAEKLGQARDTPQEQDWLDSLEPEVANVRAVNSWAIERGEIELAHRFNGLLFTFWIARRSVAEARHWLDTLLELKAAVPTTATLNAEALALDTAGYLAVVHHDFAHALAVFQRELAIHTALDNQPAIATALRGCGFAAMFADDLGQAGAYIEQSLVICRAALDRRGEAWSLYDLGHLALVRGEISQAQELLEEGLSQLREQRIVLGTFRALVALGHTMRLLDNPERARGCYREALQIHQQIHYYVPFVEDCLEGLAGMAAEEGDPARAARLFGAAQAYRTAATAPRWSHLGGQYEQDMALARSLLLAEAWDEVWAEGSRMSLEQAVAYTLDSLEEASHAAAQLTARPAEQQTPESSVVGRVKQAREQQDDLTRREVEVLRLLAQSLSDRQIAEQLVLSNRTVQAHVRSIYSKLGITNRSAATRYAIARGFVLSG
jgi:non-specific serine/threonine protein kinase